MSHIFNSTNDRQWLKESHQKRSNRSVAIGKKAIDLLIKKGELVTYTNIVQISKEVDPEKKGIHSNTIRTNEQLYNYYKQHSNTYKQKEKNRKIKPNHNIAMDEISFRKINPHRNFENTYRKYMKLSKQELVKRLFLAEQYIAENNSNWVANQFNAFK